MTLNPNSLANANAASAENVQFQPAATVLPRKILIVGTFDPAKVSVVPDEPVQIFSAGDAGDKFGFGFMIHRLAQKVFDGSRGIICFVIPQEEVGAQAAGSITFTVTTAQNGTVSLYIANDLVTFDVLAGQTDAAIAAAAIVAINADNDLPVTALIDGGDDTKVNITAKSEGLFWGNNISLAFNLRGEELPTGVSALIVAMATGSGTPDIATALDGLGTGDGANSLFITDAVHGYGQVAAVLDAIRTYIGAGNGKIGLWAELVHKPFTFLDGDVVPDVAGLTALLALGNGRKDDRSSGVLSVPDSKSHPSEIAALAVGEKARVNNNRAEESYSDIVLSGIHTGDIANRWTDQYNNRDAAVKAGISPSFVKNNAVVLQNLVTFYHPDSVPQDSNGYRSMRNISVVQNILQNIFVNFEQKKWKGITIVEDVQAVTDINDRLKARDTDAVKDDLVFLAEAFAGKAWLFNSQFTIDGLKKPGSVTIRGGATGFDNILEIILSGEGGILNTVVKFDTSLAILL